MTKDEIFELYKTISTPNNKEKKELLDLSLDMLHQMGHLADKQIEDMLKKQVNNELEISPQVDFVIGNIIDTANKSKKIFMQKFIEENDLYALVCSNTKTIFMVGDEITLIKGEAEKDKVLEMIHQNLEHVECGKLQDVDDVKNYIRTGLANGAEKIMCVYNENRGFHIDAEPIKSLVGTYEDENKELRKYMINFFQNLREGKYIKEIDNLMLNKLMSSNLYIMNCNDKEDTGKIGVELVENNKEKPIVVIFSSLESGQHSESFKRFAEKNGSKSALRKISFSGILAIINSLNMYGFVIDKNDVSFFVGGENLQKITELKKQYDEFIKEKEANKNNNAQ